jgi:hypothetical protein
VYGITEGLLLSVLPVLVTWQAFAAQGWTSGIGKPLVVGTVAMLASLAVIVIHHLGYRGFRNGAALVPVMVGCGLLSLAYLLTASPLAAVGGHILLHTALNLRGTEMPPTQPEAPTSFPSATNGQQPRQQRPSHRDHGSSIERVRDNRTPGAAPDCGDRAAHMAYGPLG